MAEEQSLQMLKTEEQLPGPGVPAIVPEHATWEMCWGNVLCLPGENISDEELFIAARRLVHAYRFHNGFGIDWFEGEVKGAQVLVAEQRAVDPDACEWRRIETALAGARSALRASPTFHSPRHLT
jgi:hypothetical protein